MARPRTSTALPEGWCSMSNSAPLAACYVRAHRAVPVLVNGPGGDQNPPVRFKGRLLGAM